MRPAYRRFPCAWGKLTGRCALAVEYLERDLLEAVDAIVDLSAPTGHRQVVGQGVEKLEVEAGDRFASGARVR